MWLMQLWVVGTSQQHTSSQPQLFHPHAVPIHTWEASRLLAQRTS